MNLTTLLANANIIKNEVAAGANTATRVGQMYIDMLNNASLSSDYRMVAGVLRNTGGGWETLTDGQHEPLNIDSVTNNTTAITVDYTSLGATKVLTSLIVPDETFVGVYNTGVSVGLTSCNIQLRHETRIGKALVTHTGSGNFTIANQEGSAFTGLSVSYNPVNGILDINHDSAKGTPHLHDWGGNTVFRKAVNTESYTQERVKLWNYDNTQQTLANPEVLRFNYTREIEVKVGAVDPNTVVSAGGNFWFMAILKV